MGLKKYKALFVVVVGITALLVASPALQRILVYPQTEFFTEAWFLGPNHSIGGSPYNITRNSNYTVYLGIANHLGSCAYYIIEVKFCNETQSEADVFNKTFSLQPSLYSMTAFVADKEVWEVPINFSFDYTNSSDENVLRIDFNNLRLNDVSLSLQGYSATWNSTKQAFYGSLSFELWLYNTTLNDFQYHQRLVRLSFNMTGI